MHKSDEISEYIKKIKKETQKEEFRECVLGYNVEILGMENISTIELAVRNEGDVIFNLPYKDNNIKESVLKNIVENQIRARFPSIKNIYFKEIKL